MNNTVPVKILQKKETELPYYPKKAFYVKKMHGVVWRRAFDFQLKLFSHACNFSCEVINFLFQAFALFKANKINKLNTVIGKILFDLHAVILNECLLEEAVLRIIFADLTVNDLVL